MKICLLSAANNVHTMRWANALSRRGHAVTVISCKDHMPDLKIAYDNDVKIVLLKYKSGTGYYLNAGRLKKIIAYEKFNVVNVHYASGYGTLGRKAKLKNALLNIWGSDVYVYPYKNAFNRKTIKKNLAYYNYVASTSNCMARQAQKFADRKFYITPFGVDTQLFKPMANVRNTDKITVGTVKALSAVYGITDSIKAFDKVLRRFKEEGDANIADKLCYEIYGRGEQRDELQRLIDGLGLTDKVTLCGYIDNDKLPAIYNRFDLFVCHSLSESFGVAAVEAMACGIPVQVSDADGFAEVIVDGVTGLLAPKGDINTIADKMHKLLTDEKLRLEMSLNGIERVKRLYEWQNNVDEMLKIYAVIA